MTATVRAATAIVAFCFGVIPTSAQSQSQVKGGTAAIAGRVTVNGKPAAGIVVMAMPAKLDAEFLQMLSGSQFDRATTDDDGRFRISGLAAGSYTILPHAPALLVSSQADADESGRPVTVGDGETVEGLSFALTRGGVITGRVTYTDGRPAINEAVRVAPADGPQSNWQANPFGQTEFHTDDRGVYRVYGVRGGRYVVSVGGAGSSGGVSNLIRRPSRPQTYHPGTTEKARATVVDLTAGGERVNIDIRLGQPTRTFKANGRVIDAETGNPVAGVMTARSAVMGESPAPSGEALALSGSGVGSVTNANGEFHIEGLGPGRHVAFAMFGVGAESDFFSDSVQFEIKYEDVTGLQIRAHRGSTASGVVTVEGNSDPAVLARLPQLQLLATVLGEASDVPSFTPNYSTSKVAPNGDFIIRGLRPGKVLIHLVDFLSQHDFSLLRVEHNGAEVRGGIPIAPGEQVTGVRVVVGYASGVIRGLVKVEGDLPKGAQILVSAQRGDTGDDDDDDDDDDARFDPLPEGQSTIADSNGRFSFEKLLPGDYRVSVLAFAKPPAGPALADAKQNVTVAASGESVVTILLDLRGKTKDR